MTDRYFDHLGARFAQRIYDSPKGAIRLAVLQRDLQQWLPALLQAESPLHILDIGAGLGQSLCRRTAETRGAAGDNRRHA